MSKDDVVWLDDVVWSKQTWYLDDLKNHFDVDDTKIVEIADTIGVLFNERIIELGWEVIHDLVQAYGLLNKENG